MGEECSCSFIHISFMRRRCPLLLIGYEPAPSADSHDILLGPLLQLLPYCAYGIIVASLISIETPPEHPGLTQDTMHNALCIAGIWDLALEFKVQSKRGYIPF